MEAVHARDIEEWMQLGTNSFVPLQAAGPDGFEGLMAHVQIDDVGVCYVRSTPSRVWRGTAEIARDPRDDIMLSLHLSGSGLISQQGRQARLVPGTASVFEADRPYELRFDRSMSQLVLQVPRRRLGLSDAVLREASARAIDMSSSTLGVLRGLLQGVVHTRPNVGLPNDLASTAANLLVASLRHEFGESWRDSLSGDSTFYSARSFLQQRLWDPALTIDATARHHGVSRRYLEALFARKGESPAKYLREARLTEARNLLQTQQATIGWVAHRVGFTDVNTFIRAFRRSTGGLTPHAWRRRFLARELDPPAQD